MRFVFTMGRLVVFDFTLFRIIDDEGQMVVVHHHIDDDEDESPDTGPDLFGGNK